MNQGASKFNRGYLHPFWDGTFFAYGVGENPRTLIELAMGHLSARIRSSPKWWLLSSTDQDTRNYWHDVGSSQLFLTPCGKIDVVLSPLQIEYVLDELRGYAALRDIEHQCQVSCFERIWDSNSLLGQNFLPSLLSDLQELRTQASSFTNDSCSTDIVDPYLHCLVYTRTREIDLNGELRPIPAPPPLPIHSYTLSSQFACLPTPFLVSPPSQPLKVDALSYINNINPSLTSLYSNLEEVIALSIPLFEHVLTDLHRNNPLPQRIPGGCRYTEWNEPEEPEHSDDEEGWLDYEREVRQWTLQRPIQAPDIPDTGYPGGLEERKLVVSLRGRTVKLIIKVTDIALNPGEPSYTGTPWHVEGMRNEHIVACAFHCLSISNMSPPSIQFRMPICSPRDFVAGDEGATYRIWGLRDQSEGTQYLGKVALTEGFSVAFPNIYQHRLKSSKGLDPEQEGLMTILSLFLVDPDLSESDDGHSEILSTSRIPPQCKEWIRKAVEESIDVRLPFEIVEKIVDMVEGLMTEEEAGVYAQQMRKEREQFWTLHDESWFCLPFNIWSGEG